MITIKVTAIKILNSAPCDVLRANMTVAVIYFTQHKTSEHFSAPTCLHSPLPYDSVLFHIVYGAIKWNAISLKHSAINFYSAFEFFTRRELFLLLNMGKKIFLSHGKFSSSLSHRTWLIFFIFADPKKIDYTSINIELSVWKQKKKLKSMLSMYSTFQRFPGKSLSLSYL